MYRNVNNSWISATHLSTTNDKSPSYFLGRQLQTVWVATRRKSRIINTKIIILHFSNFVHEQKNCYHGRQLNNFLTSTIDTP